MTGKRCLLNVLPDLFDVCKHQLTGTLRIPCFHSFKDLPMKALSPIQPPFSACRSNALFAKLDQQGIHVVSMRNKANRLEELFMRLVEKGDDR